MTMPTVQELAGQSLEQIADLALTDEQMQSLLSGETTPPPGDTPPPASPPPPAPGGDEPPGEPAVPPTDPIEAALEALAADPKALDRLLKSKVGGTLNSWNDRSAQNQVKAAEERVRRETTTETEARVTNEQFEHLVDGLSPAELLQELAADTKFAASYARLQARREAEATPKTQDVTAAATVIALETQIRAATSSMQKAQLPADEQTTLMQRAQQIATERGSDGFTTWLEEVNDAIAEHKAVGKTKTLTDTEREALRQEQLAEADKDHPANVTATGTPATGSLLAQVADKTPEQIDAMNLTDDQMAQLMRDAIARAR